jgi:hypothetical protein
MAELVFEPRAQSPSLSTLPHCPPCPPWSSTPARATSNNNTIYQTLSSDYSCAKDMYSLVSPQAWPMVLALLLSREADEEAGEVTDELPRSRGSGRARAGVWVVLHLPSPRRWSLKSQSSAWTLCTLPLPCFDSSTPSSALQTFFFFWNWGLS